MEKKTISFSIIAFGMIAFLFGGSASITHAATQPYQQLADYAIQLTKQANISYGTYTITSTSSNTGSAITLNSTTILATEEDFKNQINIARTNWFSTWSYTGFLNKLAEWNTTTKSIANNTQLDSTKRATAMLSDDFYKNYILLRNNPKFNTGTMWVRVSNSCWNNTTNCLPNSISSGLTFSPLSWYQTLSEKKYFTWTSQDDRYRFSALNNSSDIRKKGFRDLSTMYNFLEYQNRIIYIAPNSRKYGIFKQNNASSFGIRFSRDEWSISENEWANIADAKAYINQNNQPLTWCSVVKEWKCIQ